MGHAGAALYSVQMHLFAEEELRSALFPVFHLSASGLTECNLLDIPAALDAPDKSSDPFPFLFRTPSHSLCLFLCDGSE